MTLVTPIASMGWVRTGKVAWVRFILVHHRYKELLSEKERWIIWNKKLAAKFLTKIYQLVLPIVYLLYDLIKLGFTIRGVLIDQT